MMFSQVRGNHAVFDRPSNHEVITRITKVEEPQVNWVTQEITALTPRTITFPPSSLGGGGNVSAGAGSVTLKVIKEEAQ